MYILVPILLLTHALSASYLAKSLEFTLNLSHLQAWFQAKSYASLCSYSGYIRDLVLIVGSRQYCNINM